MDLNPAQREAVATLSGPLLVLAGAGTGKTRVVTYRIAELIRQGVQPARILAVTFTKKAAGEMQDRALALLGRRPVERPEISTFHSLCVRILRRNIRRLGYPEQFAIYDRGDQEHLARTALREIRVPEAALRPGDLLYLIGRWKCAGQRPADAAAVAASDKEHLAASGYRRYQEALKAAGAVDFDDLLLLTEELFAHHADARRAEAARFSHLLIDEYQDTNGPQYAIVKALAREHRNLCVVGDDDQSIYGWRGAEVTHILQFQRDWPGAKVVRLEENYRSTAPILDLANRLIAYNRHRHEKQLRSSRPGGEEPRILKLPDETSEARFVVEEIRDLTATGRAHCRDICILFRTNEQPRAFEQELRRVKVPYVLLGGQSFYDRAEVRDILSYLKVLDRPQDEAALLRIVNTPPRGLGKAAVAQLVDTAVGLGRPLWDALPDALRRPDLSPAAAKAVEEFRTLVEGLRARLASEPLAEVARDLIRTIRYQDELARRYPEPAEQETRWNSVQEVVNSLAVYERETKRPSLSGFLQDTLLEGRDDDRDKESRLSRDAVALMTLHAAKGLEFPHVYLVGLEEGLLPHHRSATGDGAGVDEERRLCYVGITRAQDRLTLTMSLTRMKWGKPRPTIPSRFLFELTGRAEKAPEARGAPRMARLSAGGTVPTASKGPKSMARGAAPGCHPQRSRSPRQGRK
jgi:DNA helicase-2/ATP-dependent DNA helicase PcrA